MGIFRTKQSAWSPYLHVDFQNASPTFPHAIVMLLYLFCLGINGEEGLEVGQRSVPAFSLAESLPNGVEARLPPPGPSAPLSCCPELGGLHSLLQLWGEQAPWEYSFLRSQAPCEGPWWGLAMAFVVFSPSFPLTHRLPVHITSSE